MADQGTLSWPMARAVATRDELKPQPFMAFAFEGGYVWDEEMISVAHKRIKRAHEDDHYANAMRCVENILLTFFVHQPSEAERIQRRQEQLYREETQENPYDRLDSRVGWMAM